jgi:hypothetical protein
VRTLVVAFAGALLLAAPASAAHNRADLAVSALSRPPASVRAAQRLTLKVTVANRRRSRHLARALEGGLGYGGGIGIDPNGGAAETGTTMHAEITEKWGPLNATLSTDLDLDCMNRKSAVSLGTAYLGQSVGVDSEGNVTLPVFGGSSFDDFNGLGVREIGEGGHAGPESKWGFGTEGKIALVGCGQF